MKANRILLKAVIILTLVAMLMVGMSQLAWGQAITSYTGSIQVQNLEAASAQIVLTFYPQSGTSTDVSDTISASGGKKYFPLPIGDGFNGSVVISSDKQIYAVSTLVGNIGGASNLYYNGIYESFSSGTTRINFPLLQANNAGNFSWFNVQNTGSSDVTFTIQFYPRDANMGSHTISGQTVQPGRAKTYKLSDYSSYLYGTAGKFVGAAVVSTSSGSLAGVAVQENTTTMPNMGVYAGFPGDAGSTKIVAPLLQFANANNTIFSSMNVQNVGAATAIVTATYTAPICPGCTYQPVQETRTIAPGKIGTFNLLEGSGQWVGGLARRWVGGASVQSSGPLLVGVATQLVKGSKYEGSQYNMFDPAKATNKAVAPLLQFDNGQTYCSVTVYNLGTNTVSVRLTYGNNTCGATCTFAPVPETATIEPSKSYNFRLLEGATPQWTSISAQQKRYVGSGVVQVISGSGPIVAVVNQQRMDNFGRAVPAGDTMVTYSTLNVTP